MKCKLCKDANEHYLHGCFLEGLRGDNPIVASMTYANGNIAYLMRGSRKGDYWVSHDRDFPAERMNKRQALDWVKKRSHFKGFENGSS